MFGLSQDMLGTLFVMTGSVFPDWVEGRPTIENYFQWRKKHRGKSHWLLVYCGLFVLLWLLGLVFPEKFLLLRFCMCFVFGAILHILEDAVCGKVPMIELRKRLGVKLFAVGSFKEYAVSLVFLGFFLVQIWSYVHAGMLQGVPFWAGLS